MDVLHARSPLHRACGINCERRAYPRGARRSRNALHSDNSSGPIRSFRSQGRSVLAIPQSLLRFLLRKIPLTFGGADLLLLKAAPGSFQIFADQLIAGQRCHSHRLLLWRRTIPRSAMTPFPTLPLRSGLANLNCAKAAAADQHVTTEFGRFRLRRSSLGRRHGRSLKR